MIYLSDVASVLKISDVPNYSITGVSIDSRRIEAGNLFVAIKGPNFDGHDFIEQAVAAGAVAVLSNHRNPDVDVVQLVVSDPLDALVRVATWHRQQLSIPTIALTGSNGKTTVKDMISCILPKPSFATIGNLNNHIGVPLSLLKLTKEHRYAVFELGASQLNDIAHTVPMVQPQVALVNNIAPAHIAGFGSLDGVAQAKGAIYQGLLPGGTAVINDDDAYAHFWDPCLFDKSVVRFSAIRPADVCAVDITFNAQDCSSFRLITPIGEQSIRLNVPGIHQISNALAAASCAMSVGIDLSIIANGLANFRGVPMRMTYCLGQRESTIIDDTYNANLRSVITALKVLSNRPGRKIFVFGDMGELGVESQKHHQEVGAVARSLGIDSLFTCGKATEWTAAEFGASATHYQNQEDLVRDLLPQLNETTTVLVKGSRSSAMENIVRQLSTDYNK